MTAATITTITTAMLAGNNRSLDVCPDDPVVEVETNEVDTDPVVVTELAGRGSPKTKYVPVKSVVGTFAQACPFALPSGELIVMDVNVV